jgi:hypothetical protein
VKAKVAIAPAVREIDSLMKFWEATEFYENISSIYLLNTPFLG